MCEQSLIIKTDPILYFMNKFIFNDCNINVKILIIMSQQVKVGRQQILEDFNSQYLFLRRMWSNCKSDQVSSQDRLDKLNKVVAMIRERVLASTKRQSQIKEQNSLNEENKNKDSQDANNENIQTRNPFYEELRNKLQCALMSKQSLYHDLYKSQIKSIQLIKANEVLQSQKYQLVRKNKQLIQKLFDISQKNVQLHQQMKSNISKMSHNRSKSSYENQPILNKHSTLEDFNEIKYISELKKKVDNNRLDESNIFQQISITLTQKKTELKQCNGLKRSMIQVQIGNSFEQEGCSQSRYMLKNQKTPIKNILQEIKTQGYCPSLNQKDNKSNSNLRQSRKINRKYQKTGLIRPKKQVGHDVENNNNLVLQQYGINRIIESPMKQTLFYTKLNLLRK